jgi:hypothetical protein
MGCACGLDRVDVASGEVRTLKSIDKALKEKAYSSPQFLPDGDRFLYFVHSDDPKVRGVYVSSLSRPDERTLLLNSSGRALYVPRDEGTDGYLLWMADQARRYDPASLVFTGDPSPIAQNVSFSELSTQVYAFERPAFWASARLLVYAPAVQSHMQSCR